MFTKKQLDRYAEVLLWGLKTARTARFKKKDIIAIRYNLPALRLAEVLFAKVLSMGMNPVMHMNPTSIMEKDFYSLADNRQLTFMPPGEKQLAKELNGSIFLLAPESLTHLRNIDPNRIAKTMLARKPIKDLLGRREANGLYSWTLCIYPTPELAGHAKLSMEEYTRQIVRACFLNRTQPVDEWRRIFKDARRIKKWLNSMDVKFYRVESDHIDLEITPGKNRKWIGISGRNIPSFEIFISPDWHGTRGKFYADQPSYRNGNLIEDVSFEFKRGIAVSVKARKGQNFVRQQLAMDSGADKLGEFSLTDKRFSRIDQFMANTLFDENYGGRYGNCHIALGSAYANTYSGNPANLTQKRKKDLGFNDSALHWDFVNTEKKRVTAHLTSGKVVTIYENGKFNY